MRESLSHRTHTGRPMNAITVCVNFSDLLSITLPRMISWFDHVTVVTDMDDEDTCLVEWEPHVSVIRTDLFYKDGSPFNKGAALDMALMKAEGWTCVIDADVYLPRPTFEMDLDDSKLYSPFRRLLETPGPIPDEKEWGDLPYGPEVRNGEYAGFFHCFNAYRLITEIGGPPWYESPMWRSARGCDTVFWRKWGPRRARRLPFEVLHLGPTRVNWEGRVSPQWRQTDER